MIFSLRHIKKKTAAIAWLLLVLLVVYPMAQHARAGVVLCFGADGHVEIEDGAASDCATESGKHELEAHFGHESVQALFQADADCGPCVDIALLSSPMDGQRASVGASASASDLVSAYTIQFGEPLLVPQVRPILTSSSYEARPFFAPLRTIVLQI